MLDVAFTSEESSAGLLPDVSSGIWMFSLAAATVCSGSSAILLLNGADLMSALIDLGVSRRAIATAHGVANLPAVL